MRGGVGEGGGGLSLPSVRRRYHRIQITRYTAVQNLATEGLDTKLQHDAVYFCLM